jgi:hypothetical protein
MPVRRTRKPEKLKPGNALCECECHSGKEVEHPIPCCYVCPKCDGNIAAHIYNAHVSGCSRKDVIKEQKKVEEEKRIEEQKAKMPPPKPSPAERRRRLVDRPTLPGSTKSRHRKR